MSTVKSTKCVRKLERPRPLRLNSDSDGASTASTIGPDNGVLTDSPETPAFPEEEVVRELERLHTSVNNGNFDATLSTQIRSLCAMLTAKGASMDSANRKVLDRYFVTLRNAARDERLDACSRLRLLQMIELRGMGWQGNRNVQDFYQRMIQQLEEEESEHRTTDSSTSPSGASFLNSSWTPLGKASTRKQLAVQSLSTVVQAKSPPQPTDMAKSLGVSGQLAGIPGRNVLRDGAAMQGLDYGRVPVVPGAHEHRPVQTRGAPVVEREHCVNKMSAAKSTKCVRKLERPRPLRLNSDSDGASTASTNGPANGVLTDSPEPSAFPEEEVVRELERLHTSVNNGNFDATLSAQIGSLCAMLAAKGASMDSSNREVLDRYFVTLRNAAREERLDACSRLRLLQMIELRGMGWQGNRNVQDFYQRMIQQLEEEESEQRTTDSSTSPSGASLLNSSWTPLGKASTQKQLAVQSLSTVAPAMSPPQPTGMAKSLGVSGQLAGISGRNLLTDGAAMQGLGSGRVPVVPGAREHRPVQTRGRPSGEEGALGRNKDLVGRSASPAVQGGGDGTAAGHRAAPEANQRLSLVQRGGMGDASMGGFTATLNVAGDTVRISGGNPALVRACKMVVEKYFAGEMVFSDRAAADLPAQRENERAAKASSSSEPVTHGSTGGLAACGPGDLQSGGHQAGSPSGGEGEAVGRHCRGGPQDRTVAAAQSAKCTSIVRNVAPQADADASSTVDARGQARQLKRRESCPAFSARSRPPQVQSSVSLEASDPSAGAPPSRTRSYSRDFLLQCSQSDLALRPPPDFPPLDPEVENLMVKEDRRHSAAHQEGN